MKVPHLHSIDVFVLLKIAANSRALSQHELADQLDLSASTVNDCIQRASVCNLYNRRRRVLVVRALTEFLEHGIRYVFPVVRGNLIRGVPTSYAARPLRDLLTAPTDWPPVWASASGLERGYEINPLHANAPKACASDESFYELLTLVDALREGRSRREIDVAIAELIKRLAKYEKTATD